MQGQLVLVLPRIEVGVDGGTPVENPFDLRHEFSKQDFDKKAAISSPRLRWGGSCKFIGILQKMDRFSNNLMTQDEKIDFIQELVDTGMVYDMHDKYQEAAAEMINSDPFPWLARIWSAEMINSDINIRMVSFILELTFLTGGHMHLRPT